MCSCDYMHSVSRVDTKVYPSRCIGNNENSPIALVHQRPLSVPCRGLVLLHCVYPMRHRYGLLSIDFAVLKTIEVDFNTSVIGMIDEIPWRMCKKNWIYFMFVLSRKTFK